MSRPRAVVTRTMARLRRRISLRRSTRSAMVPATMPRKKKGAILAAEATPTMNGESVIRRTSQPKMTCSPANPAASKTVDRLRIRKSRMRIAGARRTSRINSAADWLKDANAKDVLMCGSRYRVGMGRGYAPRVSLPRSSAPLRRPRYIPAFRSRSLPYSPRGPVRPCDLIRGSPSR